MEDIDPRLPRTITWIAGSIAALIGVALPLFYFFGSYHLLVAVLDTETEINSRIASQVINANPELWRFQHLKLEEFLKRRPRHGAAEVRRVTDTNHQVIAESTDPLAAPVLWRSTDLLDSGVVVGKIEIGRSLRPLLFETGWVAVLSLVLGWGSFVALRILPLRALRRAAAENLKLLQALKERTVELDRSNKELEHFAYTASHDLQEPLRMITGYTNLLAKRYKGKLDTDADEFIDYATDGAKRLQGMINAILAYSRVGTKGKDFEPTDCEAVIERTLASLRVAIEESGAVVTHDPLPTVMGDARQLGQLFQNLIGNGVKFRNEKPPVIHVSCKREGKEWLFSVKDNGIGIDPKDGQRIFSLFQRLHTRAEYPGTGIGLAVCKRIVERHGGRIWVESEAGEGSTFHFTLQA